MRAVHEATGVMQCELAVRSDSVDKGVVTFRSLRQSSSVITETAAPVSTNASTIIPSTDTSITFVGGERGLVLFDWGAVLAS